MLAASELVAVAREPAVELVGQPAHEGDLEDPADQTAARQDGQQLLDRCGALPGAAARPDELVVAVDDTGPGIPPGELSKIFEPFWTTKPQGRGTGLGLSICYGIIEDHRGRIEVDSQPGRGSSFQVFLPTAAEAA